MHSKKNSCRLLCISLLIFLFSCTPSSKKLETQNNLIVGISTTANTIDPRFATDAIGSRLADLVFSSLVVVGPDLRPQSDLAETWNYDKKKKIWKFQLKPNLSFSNGRLVEKEDILFTFQEFLKKENIFHSAFSDIKKVDVIKENNRFLVHIYLKKYSAKFLLADLPAIRLIPKKEVLEQGKDFFKTLIGTGSFSFESKNDQMIVLKARKNHPYAPPKVDGIIFKIIRDDFTRYQKLIKQEIDLVQENIPASKIKYLEEKKDDFVVYRTESQVVTYLVFNLRNEILKQKKVRQAIAYSLNLDPIIQFNLEGLAVRAFSLLPPSNPFFEKNLKKIKHSLSKSKKLLKNIKLKPLVLKTSNNSEVVQNAKVLISQIQGSGMSIKLQTFEWGTFYSFLKKGQFDIALSSFVGVLDPDIYRRAFHSEQTPPQGFNRGFYKDKKADSLIEKGNLETSYEERFKVYSQLQKKIHDEDIAILPLWHKKFIAVVNKKVQGYRPWINGSFQPFVQVYKKTKK